MFNIYQNISNASSSSSRLAFIASSQSSSLTTSGVSFYLQNDVRFNYSSSFDDTIFSVYQYDSSNNPEYYLLKKTGKAISATTKTQQIVVGDPVRYFTTQLFDSNIIGIESIVDSDGNEYHEVDYLAQDTKFIEE